MVQLDETTLVNRCQAGDIEAFSELVERNNKKAIHTAYLITGCRDIAEDIAQEAFIQCFHSIRKLRDTTLFKSWFYKILVRTSWRMVSNAKKMQVIDCTIKGDDIPDYNDFTENIEKKHACETIYRIVSALSKPLREVVILYYFNGFSIKEIAYSLNCREGTVKSRLHNARKQIEACMKKYGWDFIDHKEAYNRKTNY